MKTTIKTEVQDAQRGWIGITAKLGRKGEIQLPTQGEINKQLKLKKGDKIIVTIEKKEAKKKNG